MIYKGIMAVLGSVNIEIALYFDVDNYL